MKKSKLIFTILLLINFNPFAFSHRGLNIGFNSSIIPDRMFGNTLPHAKISSQGHVKTYFSNGFSNGLTFRYGFNDSFYISTGYERGYRKVRTSLVDNSLATTLTVGETMDMLEIPVKLSYVKKITQKNLTWTTTIGGSLNFLTIDSYQAEGYEPNNSINTYTSIFSTIDHNNENAIIKSLILGTGFEKNYGHYGSIYVGISFHIQPTKKLNHYTSYKIGNISNHIKDDFQASTIKLDFTYFLPWRILTQKK